MAYSRCITCRALLTCKQVLLAHCVLLPAYYLVKTSLRISLSSLRTCCARLCSAARLVSPAADRGADLDADLASAEAEAEATVAAAAAAAAAEEVAAAGRKPDATGRSGSGGCMQPLLPACGSTGACARRARAQRLAAGGQGAGREVGGREAAGRQVAGLEVAGRRPIVTPPRMHPRRATLHAELEEEGGDEQREGGGKQREGAGMLSEREAEARKHLVLVLMQARIEGAPPPHATTPYYMMLHPPWC